MFHLNPLFFIFLSFLYPVLVIFSFSIISPSFHIFLPFRCHLFPLSCFMYFLYPLSSHSSIYPVLCIFSILYHLIPLSRFLYFLFPLSSLSSIPFYVFSLSSIISFLYPVFLYFLFPLSSHSLIGAPKPVSYYFIMLSS